MEALRSESREVGNRGRGLNRAGSDVPTFLLSPPSGGRPGSDQVGLSESRMSAAQAQTVPPGGEGEGEGAMVGKTEGRTFLLQKRADLADELPVVQQSAEDTRP